MLPSNPSLRLSTSNSINLVFNKQVLQHHSCLQTSSSKQRMQRLYVNVSQRGRPCQSPWETVSTNRIHCWQPSGLALTNHDRALRVGGSFSVVTRLLKSANIKCLIHDYSVLLVTSFNGFNLFFVTKFLGFCIRFTTFIKLTQCICFLV